MAIIQKVLNMHHFMMDSDQIFVIDICTHFNSKKESQKFLFNTHTKKRPPFNQRRTKRSHFHTDRYFDYKNPTTMLDITAADRDVVVFQPLILAKSRSAVLSY